VNDAAAGFIRCRRCKAWALRDGGRCELCGVAAPGGWRPELRGSEILGKHVGMVVGGAGGGVLVMITAAAIAHGAGSGPIATAAASWLGGTVGAIAGLSWGAMLGAWLDDNHLYPPARRSVREIEQRVRRRKAELEASLVHIDAARKRIKATVDADRALPALAALDAAERATVGQIARYHVELWRVELLYWHNRLRPMEASWERADHDTCEAWLTDLMGIVRDGRAMLDRYTASSRSGTADGLAAITRLQEALDACEALRQGLVLRQAATLTAGSPGIEEAFNPAALSPEALDGLARLGAHMQVGRLLDVLPMLEEESSRLDAEMGAIGELEEL